AGALVLAHQVTVVPDQFSLKTSLLFLAIAVVGGLRSLGGAAAASVVFAGLNELFFRVPSLGRYLQLVSAALLAPGLLGYPGGLAAVPAGLRRLRARLRPAAAPAEPIVDALEVDLTDRHRTVPAPASTNGDAAPTAVIEAQSITVRFGGLVA